MDFECWANSIEYPILQHAALYVMCWEAHDSGMTYLSLLSVLFDCEIPSLAEYPKYY